MKEIIIDEKTKRDSFVNPADIVSLQSGDIVSLQNIPSMADELEKIETTKKQNLFEVNSQEKSDLGGSF